MLRDTQALLGHESVATTEVYTRISPARLRRVVQAPDFVMCNARETKKNAREGL